MIKDIFGELTFRIFSSLPESKILPAQAVI